MATIPDIQKELRELADAHGIPRLKALADQLKRRKRKTNAPRSSVKMTKALAKQIRVLHSDCPDLTQADIARQFNINPGRVSEVLAGKRK